MNAGIVVALVTWRNARATKKLAAETKALVDAIRSVAFSVRAETRAGLPTWSTSAAPRTPADE